MRQEQLMLMAQQQAMAMQQGEAPEGQQWMIFQP
jgi:hypothetical protein